MASYRFLPAVAVGAFALVAGSLFAFSGSGDSALGTLDTVPPVPGVATVPATGGTDVTITFSGASDDSGLAAVELWAREDSVAWSLSDSLAATSGSFVFTPGASGTYHFDLVAEDTVGNRSNQPAGAVTVGQGTTVFGANVGDWSLYQ